jgi:hypothetical protein
MLNMRKWAIVFTIVLLYVLNIGRFKGHINEVK